MSMEFYSESLMKAQKEHVCEMYQIGPEVVSYTEKKIKRLSERLDSIEENGEEDADELQT